MVAAPGACTRKDDRGKPEAEEAHPHDWGMADCGSGYLDDYGSIEKFLSYFGYS